MKLAKTLNIQHCTLYCVHCSLLLLMIINSVSLMPADERYNHDENSESGNDSYAESQMTDCQCNDTSLTMLNKRFLLMWLNFAENHSIRKLLLEVHKLKDATNNLEVSRLCIASIARCVYIIEL